MIYVTGDTHGIQGRLYQIHRTLPLRAGDTVIVCGDFGFLLTGSENEQIFLDDLERAFPATLCFVSGNHENFPLIQSYPVQQWNDGKVHHIRQNIYHLMNGQVFQIEGKKIFTMGGAYSIDRDREYIWPDQELPSDEEYDEAILNLTANNWTVDYILTHTAPTSVIHGMGKTPHPGDATLTVFLEMVRQKAEFSHWYLGHWHEDRGITPKCTCLYYDIIKI